MYKNFCRSTIHNSQKMEKVQISAKWWMDKKFGIPKPWNITSSIRRNEVLIYATTWINFKDDMLSQRCQRQKTTCYLIPFIWNIQNRQLARDTKHMRVCQILGIEGMESDCFFFLGFIYSWETGKERERGRDPGRGRSRLHSGSVTWDSIPGLQDQTLDWRWRLTTEPPGLPREWLLNG